QAVRTQLLVLDQEGLEVDQDRPPLVLPGQAVARDARVLEPGELLTGDLLDPAPIRRAIRLARARTPEVTQLGEEPAQDDVDEGSLRRGADRPGDLLLRSLRGLDADHAVEQVAEWAGRPRLDARGRVTTESQTAGELLGPAHLGLDVAVEFGEAVRQPGRAHL